MARKKLPLNSIFPYHILARSNNSEWFKVEPQKCWDIFSECLFYCSKVYDAKIHAFVLMSNHFHLLLSVTNHDLGLVMNRFMTNVSFYINQESKTKNHVFGGRYKGCLVTNPFYYSNCLKYIYRNPVKAGLTANVEDYPFSSLNGLLGGSKILFPVTNNQLFRVHNFFNIEDEISWLNTKFRENHNNEIKKSLYRSEFKVSSKRTSEENYLLSSQLC